MLIRVLLGVVIIWDLVGLIGLRVRMAEIKIIVSRKLVIAGDRTQERKYSDVNQ